MELHVIEREGRKTVVLLDNEMRIVKPVYDYLKFQRQKDKSCWMKNNFRKGERSRQYFM